MGNKISILIADDNVEFCGLLEKFMARYDDICVVGAANDGIQTIEMIKSKEPDVVILDIIMPNLDGIGVLERISSMKLKHKPLFLMVSAIGQDVFIQKAINLGAEYYIIKPFSTDILVSRIKQMFMEKYIGPIIEAKVEPEVITNGTASDNPGMSIQRCITSLMHDVGIPPHIAGYRYIREAVFLIISDSDMFNSVTKVIYPSVAKKFNTTPQRVERAIRNAIENAWLRRKHEYGYDMLKLKKNKPTNSEFINFAAEKVKKEMGIK